MAQAMVTVNAHFHVAFIGGSDYSVGSSLYEASRSA